VTKRISDDHLRRVLAGESKRAIAREIGFSDTALRKRLKSAVVAKRLRVMEEQAADPDEGARATEKGSLTTPNSSRPNPSSRNTPPQTTAVEEAIVVREPPRASGGVGSYSFQGSGKGLGHFGFSHDGGGSDTVSVVAREHAARVAVRKGPRVYLVDESEVDDYLARGWLR